MTVLDLVLWGCALLLVSLVGVVSMRYLGLIPATTPPKRSNLFENESGERQNPLVERTPEVRQPVTQRSTQAGTDARQVASDHTAATGGTHPDTRPAATPTADEATCPSCGFHDQSAYSFCTQCGTRLRYE